MMHNNIAHSFRGERNMLAVIAAFCYALVLCALPLFFFSTIGEGLIIAVWCWAWSRAARTIAENAKAYHRLYRDVARP